VINLTESLKQFSDSIKILFDTASVE